MNWPKSLKSRIRLNEPLKDKTTFKIGGPARFFCEPRDEDELKLLIISAKRYNIPVFVLGFGSNLLVSDKGVSGLVIKLNSGFFKKVSGGLNYLHAASGVSLSQLIRKAQSSGLSGIEFLAGIPGTVGGALAMNAGAYSGAIGNFVHKVKVMDYNGNTRVLNKKDIKFGYRKSSLGKYIIINCSLRLVRKNKEEIKDNIKKYLKCRFDSQDTAFPNAGCIFKNPRNDSAGRLIDLCGLKGRRRGGAVISKRHANFILNKSRAGSRDVIKLMDLMRETVKRKRGINLNPEIKIWQ